MSRGQQTALGVLVLLLAIGGGAFVYWQAGETPTPRPGFTLADLDGQPHSIADYDGAVVVINFWASWCKPCREEIPMLVQAQRDWADQGFQVLGIAVDTPEAARAFAKDYEINYPVLANPIEGARIQDQYTGQGTPAGVLPYTAVVARDGTIAARVAGALSRTRLAQIVTPLLEKDAPATKDE